MFCIFHKDCRSNKGDNGNCSIYPTARVVRVNAQLSKCSFLKEATYTFEKDKSVKKKRNPIKQSKLGK